MQHKQTNRSLVKFLGYFYYNFLIIINLIKNVPLASEFEIFFAPRMSVSKFISRT